MSCHVIYWFIHPIIHPSRANNFPPFKRKQKSLRIPRSPSLQAWDAFANVLVAAVRAGAIVEVEINQVEDTGRDDPADGGAPAVGIAANGVSGEVCRGLRGCERIEQGGEHGA